MTVEIRKAKPEDVGAMVELNQKLFDYEYENFDKTLDCSWPPNNKDYFENSTKDKNSIALVAILDNKIVGYLVGTIHKPSDFRNIKELAELDNMLILKEHRGKGIGKALFDKFLEWSKEEGVKRLKVIASAKSKGAIDFYKRCGFFDYNLILEQDIQ